MLLSGIVFLPIIFAIVLAGWTNHKTIKLLAFSFALIEFLLSLTVFYYFDSSSPSLQLIERHVWIERFGITYFLGVDGLSLLLVILTTFLTPVVLLGSWSSIADRVKGFLISIFILETAMLGSFLAIDAVFFYLFWELSLVPMYFIIGIWGGPRRIYASAKFFIYSMLGSVLMLAAIIYLMFLTEKAFGVMSSSLLDFYRIDIPFVGGQLFSLQSILFFAFAIAFSIKVPLFPFHTWLPDAHVEAPTSGSVILAGVMLKMGTYGFMRWTIPLFPDAAEYWSWLFMILGAIGIVYGSLVAMVQPDIKKLVAYSSVAHMGFVLIGLFSFNEYGATGALFQMLNHGISTGALFLLVGMLYERTHSREISKYGGLAGVLPLFTICFFIVTLSSIAVPLTNGFVGEFLILLGAFKDHKIISSTAVLGVILSAVYMLWMFKKVFYGEKGPLLLEIKKQGGELKDLLPREMFVIFPLIILIFWMGIFPGHFLNWSKVSLESWSKSKSEYRLSLEPAGSNSNSMVKAKKNTTAQIEAQAVTHPFPQGDRK